MQEPYNAPLNETFGNNPNDTSRNLTPEDRDLSEEIQTLHTIMAAGHVSKDRVENFFRTRGTDIRKYTYCPLDHSDEENASNSYIGEGSASINPRIVPRNLLMAMEVSPYLCENHLAEIGLRNAQHDLAKIDYLVVPKGQEFSDVEVLSQRLEDAKVDFNVVNYIHPSMTGKAEQRQALVFYVKDTYKTLDSKLEVFERLKGVESSIEGQQAAYIDGRVNEYLPIEEQQATYLEDKESEELRELLTFKPFQVLQQIVESITRDYRIDIPENPTQDATVVFKNNWYYVKPEVRLNVVKNLEIANRAVQSHNEGRIDDEELEDIVSILATNTVPPPLAIPIRPNVYRLEYVPNYADEINHETRVRIMNSLLRRFGAGFQLEDTEPGAKGEVIVDKPQVTKGQLDVIESLVNDLELYNLLMGGTDSGRGSETMAEVTVRVEEAIESLRNRF